MVRSDTQDLAVGRADVALSVIDEVVAAGDADLIEDALAVGCRACSSRISSSTWEKQRSVSSIRVPGGAVTCSRTCPASTVGKKTMSLWCSSSYFVQLRVELGIVMIVNLSISLTTRRSAPLVTITASIAKVRIGDVVKELIPFYVVAIGLLLGFAYLPWLTIR